MVLFFNQSLLKCIYKVYLPKDEVNFHRKTCSVKKRFDAKPGIVTVRLELP